MYIDFAQSEKTAFEADICIIGAGAAGFSCAVSLLSSGLRVLILEGGLQTPNTIASSLHRAEVTNQRHTGVHEGRERIVGGTTTKWGGQALPFMEEDFQQRAHVATSGWPLSLQELLPYYQKAEEILGTDSSVPYAYRPWQDWRVKEPKFSSPVIDLFVTKWSKMPNFAQQHGPKIKDSAHVQLLMNANVLELLPNESNNSVEALRISTIDGKEGIIHATYIIAAGGALETIRLFLASKKFGDKGIGNGLAGKYFQDHVAAVVGRVIPNSRSWLHDIFDPFYRRGFKYLPRIKLSPTFAKKLEILHASAQIIFVEQQTTALNAAKGIAASLRRKEKINLTVLKSLINPANVFAVTNALLRWKVYKRGSSARAGAIFLEVHSEQEPIADSYVQLSTEVDALGMPRIKLNWTISDLTVKSIRRMAEVVKEEFEYAGIGQVHLEPWVSDEGAANPRQWLADTYHQAGGLRMATTAQEGVVDPNCKVFGIDNLYVASSAVFPTSSFSNPTMTIIALAVRIIETVEKRLQKEDVQVELL